MYLSDLIVIGLSLCPLIRGAQIPIQNVLRPSGLIGKEQSWDLKVRPAANSTDHLVFDSVSSLLQQWTNTRYRNGHSIVPGIIPLGTLLYHGTLKNEIPSEPDWTSVDPEHAYIFCRDSHDKGLGCWHLALTTTRPLKVLYFDGSSAAKMRDGAMDSQDILIWGEVKPEWTYEEGKRINALCEWGTKLGLDGFVRMEMDFEVMLCDFTDGVEIVSFLNIVYDPLPPPPHSHNLTQLQNQTLWPELFWDGPTSSAQLGVLEAGSWHSLYPGDTRIRLSLPHLVSFYDLSLSPSLVPLRSGKERFFHRLEGIADVDVKTWRSRLTEALSEWQNDQASGIDWQTLFRVVMDRFASRLDILRYLLNYTAPQDTSKENILAAANQVQVHLRMLLMPYVQQTSTPPYSAEDRLWAEPVYKYCATTHTTYLDSLSSKMTRSERLLLNAVKGTNREICRVIVGMWADGIMARLHGTFPNRGSQRVDNVDTEEDVIHALMNKWRHELEQLMTWLDWGVWVKCIPSCGPKEICYLPTWPFFSRDPDRPNPRDPQEGTEWLRPQPRCIPRVEP